MAANYFGVLMGTGAFLTAILSRVSTDLIPVLPDIVVRWLTELPCPQGMERCFWSQILGLITPRPTTGRGMGRNFLATLFRYQ